MQGYFALSIVYRIVQRFMNPWVGLRRLLSYFRPGGHAGVGPPNTTHGKTPPRLILRTRFAYKPLGVRAWNHLRCFTGKSIEGMPALRTDITGHSRHGLLLAVRDDRKARLVVHALPRVRRFFEFVYSARSREEVAVPTPDYALCKERFAA